MLSGVAPDKVPAPAWDMMTLASATQLWTGNNAGPCPVLQGSVTMHAPGLEPRAPLSHRAPLDRPASQSPQLSAVLTGMRGRDSVPLPPQGRHSWPLPAAAWVFQWIQEVKKRRKLGKAWFFWCCKGHNRHHSREDLNHTETLCRFLLSVL
jgi:hypothetical protein